MYKAELLVVKGLQWERRKADVDLMILSKKPLTEDIKVFGLYYLTRCDEKRSDEINGQFNDADRVVSVDDVEDDTSGSTEFLAQNEVVNGTNSSMAQMQGVCGEVQEGSCSDGSTATGYSYQGTHKKTRARWVRKTGDKRPMMREAEVVEQVELLKTKIVLRAKKKPAEKSKKVKEMYVDDPDQIHDVTLISAESERLRLERIKRQQRLQVEQTRKTDSRDVGGPLEGLAVRNETQDDMDSLDSDKTISTPRLETIVDKREEDDALNITDNVLRYLNETHTPSLEDVGFPRLVGTLGLDSHDGSSRKENPSGDSVDLDRLIES
ncbi:hypothetical protein Tco_1077315 [Tanacetum coccineum]